MQQKKKSIGQKMARGVRITRKGGTEEEEEQVQEEATKIFKAAQTKRRAL